jgi:hypothetical protein
MFFRVMQSRPRETMLGANRGSNVEFAPLECPAFTESAEPLYLFVLAVFPDAKPLHTFAGDALEQRAF